MQSARLIPILVLTELSYYHDGSYYRLLSFTGMRRVYWYTPSLYEGGTHPQMPITCKPVPPDLTNGVLRRKESSGVIIRFRLWHEGGRGRRL